MLVVYKEDLQMKYTGMSRPVDELGRIVIPKEIRNALGINTKDLLEIHLDNNTIVLKKSENKCALCGSTDDLLPFNDRFVCTRCTNSLKSTL